MKIIDTEYVVSYRAYRQDKDSPLNVVRFDNFLDANTFLSSLKRLCSHTEIVKHIKYKPSF